MSISPAERSEAWAGLFSSAFTQSRNGMLLVDDSRRLIDANAAALKLLGRSRDVVVGQPLWLFVVHGPQASPREWAAAVAAERFSGETAMLGIDGSSIGVQWGASTEVVTGRRLILFVVLSTSRWGQRFRRDVDEPDAAPLSDRERQVLHLVAAGNTGPEIADELHITHHTVRTHVRNAMSKTGARSRAHLVAKALGDGLLFD